MNLSTYEIKFNFIPADILYFPCILKFMILNTVTNMLVFMKLMHQLFINNFLSIRIYPKYDEKDSCGFTYENHRTCTI